MQNHNRWVSRFLEYKEALGIDLSDLGIGEVDSFLIQWLPTLSRRTRHGVIGVMRKFLGFLHHEDIIKTNLAAQVIGVRAYRDVFLPKGLSRCEVERVLTQVDREKQHGQRDYAVVILLAIYGLRASEVVALQEVRHAHPNDIIDPARTGTVRSIPCYHIGTQCTKWFTLRTTMSVSGIFGLIFRPVPASQKSRHLLDC